MDDNGHNKDDTVSGYNEKMQRKEKNLQKEFVLAVLLFFAVSHAQLTTTDEADDISCRDDRVVDMLSVVSDQLRSLTERQRQLEATVAEILAKLTPTTNQPSGSSSTCWEGWRQYGQSCYLVPSVTKRWHDAEKYCRMEYPGAKLATMESVDEILKMKEVIYEAYQRRKHVWLGGLQRGNEFYWQHCVTDTNCTYEIIARNLWILGQPDNTGDFVEFGWPWGGQSLLNDLWDSEQVFLCKYKL